MILKDVSQKEVFPNVIHLEFPNQELMASVFLRFQEYYESPIYKGKVFTFQEFKEWYISVKGAFTYAADWPGFNIPSSILAPFYEGQFNPLSEGEKEFLELFKNKKGLFYIIGTSEENGAEYLVHEFAHAFFYIYPEYKKEALVIIGEIDTAPLKKIISHEQAGYHESVMTDEIQAHLVANFDLLVSEGLDAAKYAEPRKKLVGLYDSYIKK